MSFCFKKNVLFLYTGALVIAASLASRSVAAVLEWNPTGEPQVAGYKAYIGQRSRNYIRVLDTKLQTWVTLTGLDAGTTYYLAATAYDVDGLESDFSAEVPYTPPVDGVTAIMLPFTYENSSEGMVFRMNGTPGQRCWIVASSDLRTWEQIRSFTFTDTSTVEVSDPSAGSFPMRFYRVIASAP
jgi:hypothetical protein